MCRMLSITMNARQLALSCALVSLVAPAAGDTGAVVGEWRHHGGDHAASKYSPLAEIDAANFEELRIAWRWQSADHRIPREKLYATGDFRATPLMIGGRVYAATSHGQVAALDAGTGQELWLVDPQSYARGMPNMQPLQTRGIEYWRDGETERIFVATIGKQLVSIDIATGRLDPAFGDGGIVDLAKDLGSGDFEVNNVTHGAPPIAVGNSVVVGSKIFDYTLTNDSPPGHVRAYDARTGEFKWRFHTIPQEGDAFTETWENEAWRRAGNTNVWTMMAADEELGLVYLPVSTPTNDYWGGERLGANVYAESLVCVDAETGERVWHFQTIHHGLWDYDIAAAPNLVDIQVDGKRVKAVAQVSKNAFTYVFDRRTGKPVWPIEERAVPQSDVPGERTHPTQPFPTKPPPFDRQGVGEADLNDFTPELKAEALAIAEQFRLGPIYTPPIVKGAKGKLATLVVPGAGGGANFPGASLDPETGILYVDSVTRPTGHSLVPPRGKSDWRYVIEYLPARGPQGLPLLKPPYRRITAIDLNAGEHVWQIPFGRGPADHPAIKAQKLGPLGGVFTDSVAEGGILVTKTLLITYIAKRDHLADPRATGTLLRAYDKATGALRGEVDVAQRLHGAPMTYSHQGRQYIAVAAGGRRQDAELIAFALPETETQ